MVWHALCDIARLVRGKTIFVHAGVEGKGQAAMQIAKCFGGELFVTVGSDAKTKLIMNSYEISDDRIFNNRDTFFC